MIGVRVIANDISNVDSLPPADGNILANLNEVRQIMQHDHIEMLEKLLELHIQ